MEESCNVLLFSNFGLENLYKKTQKQNFPFSHCSDLEIFVKKSLEQPTITTLEHSEQFRIISCCLYRNRSRTFWFWALTGPTDRHEWIKWFFIPQDNCLTYMWFRRFKACYTFYFKTMKLRFVRTLCNRGFSEWCQVTTFLVPLLAVRLRFERTIKCSVCGFS